MSTEYKDKNGNSPEVGGKLILHNCREYIIRRVDRDILIFSRKDCHKCNTAYLPELIKYPVEFKPKPEEPKREIPPDGTPVKIDFDGNTFVYISSGTVGLDGDLRCYGSSTFSGNKITFSDWEVIK